MKGPANPDRLPSELIPAIPAAAEVPVRKALGIGHSRGGVAETPIWLRQSKPSTSAGAEPTPARPTAARSMAKQTCSRRFNVRSELRLSRTIPTAPNKKGTADSRPVWKLLTPKFLMIVGKKNATP